MVGDGRLNKRNAWLLLVVLVLGVLVFLDNYPLTESAPDTKTADRGESERGDFAERMRVLQRVLKAEGDIKGAYQSLAVDYATSMAGMATFYLGEDRPPKQVAGQAIRQLIEPLKGVSIRNLTFGEPRERGSGIHLVSSSIELEALTHEGAIESLMQLGQPAHGLVWEEFDLQADVEKQKVRITGQLLAVVVRSAE